MADVKRRREVIMNNSDSIQIAFKCNHTPPEICTLSEIKKGDIYFLVSDGKRSDLMKATSDAYLKNNQWIIEGYHYE